jgi:2'-5' RNA ligase
MRCFVAIPMPDAAVEILAPVIAALPFGRPTEADDLHLTLAFLGEQPDDLVEAAHCALEALSFPAFALRLAGLGTFGEPDPSVIWTGVAAPDPLAALASKVRSALHGAGLVLDRARFRPHVTLARLPRTGPEERERLARFLSRWSGFASQDVPVGAFALYRSHLRKSGAVHEMLASYPLRRP